VPPCPGSVPPRGFLGGRHPLDRDHFKVVATKVGENAAVEPTPQASELAKVTRSPPSAEHLPPRNSYPAAVSRKTS